MQSTITKINTDGTRTVMTYNGSSSVHVVSESSVVNDLCLGIILGFSVIGAVYVGSLVADYLSQK